MRKSASVPQSLRMTETDDSPEKWATVLDMSHMGTKSVLYQPLSDSASRLARTGMVSLHRNDMDKTFNCLDEAITLSPNFSGAYRHRAHAHLKCGLVQQAAEDLSMVLDADTSMSSDWNDRAAARESFGDHAGAIQDCNEAIARNTYLTPAWSRRGLAKMHLQDYADAEEDYDQALTLDPGDAEIWRNRGLTRFALGNTMGAAEDLSQAITLHPSSGNYLTRAEARLECEDFAGTVRDCTQAIHHDDQKVDAWCCRALAKKRKGDLQEARSDCTEAIHRKPDYVKAWELRAEINCLLGAWVAVVDDCNQAIRLHSTDAMMWCYRGKANFQRGRFSRAVLDYEGALKQDTSCELATVMLTRSRKSIDQLTAWKLKSIRSSENYGELESLQMSSLTKRQTDWAKMNMAS